MRRNSHETARCTVCGTSKPISEMLPGEFVRPPIAGIILKSFPRWEAGGYICRDDLNRFRTEYIEDVIETDKGELSSLDEQVVKSMKEYELLSSNVNIEFERRLTPGEHMADLIASFGGSWRFITIFSVVLVFWIVLNSVIIMTRPFDPYPFILLNLVLSCLAAVQAPIIMMSQNRQEDRDRMRAEHDYRVNLKAELEIRHLHEKMDHLLMNQWQRLLKIQELQLDIMEELSRSRT